MPDRTSSQPERPGLLSRAAAGVLTFLEKKAAPAMAYRHSAHGGSSGGAWWGDGRSSVVLGMPGDDRDTVADAGDVWQNSVVAACLGWLTDQFAEPEFQVMSLDPESDDYKARATHPLVDLIEAPNPAYDSDALWAATVLSYQIGGNAYWLKVRNRARTEVLELWWVPSGEITPVWPDDGSAFISGYEHRVDGVSYDIPIEDVVHFRRGMDPVNPRLGLAPLGAVIREVATDNEASIYEAAVLRNKGIVGVLIQPAESGDEIQPAEQAILEQQFQAKTTGTNRGRALVSSARLDIKEFGRSPAELGLGAIRNIPEDRICAATGVNAQVLGLSGGKSHNTYENQAAATRGAYNRGLVPMQRSFARALTRQLLWADFKGRRGVDYCDWNYDEVAALVEDANARVTRAVSLFKERVIKRGEACEIAGCNPPDPEYDVYLESQAVAQATAQADARDDGQINDSVTGGKPGVPAGGRGDAVEDDDDMAADGSDAPPIPRLRIAKALARVEAGKNGHAGGDVPSSSEREDDADPFSRLAGQVARLADGRPTDLNDRDHDHDHVHDRKATPFLDPEDDDDFIIDLRPDADDPIINPPGWGEDDDEAGADEANTHDLPTGKPIASKLREFFDAQLKDLLGTIRTIGADLGDPAAWATGVLPAIPAGLGDYDRPMAESMTPLIGAYWDESGRRTMAKLGLDPDEWRVVDPHTRAKIEGAALAFSRSTNETTTKDLRTALDTLRDELAAGIVDRGETLPQLTKRVQGVFEGASKNRAKVIAETEASRAVHQAQLESARQSGVVWGKKLLLSTDACEEICQATLAGMPEGGWPLDDEVRNDGRGHPNYSSIVSTPLHPRCRCTVLLVTWEEAPAHVVRPEREPIFPADIPVDEPERTPKPRPLPVVKPKPTPKPKPERTPKPKPKPAPKPVAQPAPVVAPVVPPPAAPGPVDHAARIETARREQREANARAQGDPAYGKLRRKFPDLIPPGKIADRLAAYKVGDAKIEAILAVGEENHREATRLAAEKADLATAIRDRTNHQNDLVRPYVAARKPVPPHVAEQARAAQAEIDAAIRRQVEIDVALDASETALREAAHKHLAVSDRASFYGDRADFPMKQLKDLDPLDGPTQANADRAIGWLTSVVARGDSSTVAIKLGQRPGQRAYHSYDSTFIAMMPNQGTDIIVHEYGHAIEEQFRTGMDKIVDRSYEFLKYRVGSEPLTNLREKFGEFFEPSEFGRKDKFAEAFGDDHNAYYVGKDYGPSITEILAMGIQKLYNDPVGFAKADPEYLKYVLGSLDGSLR